MKIKVGVSNRHVHLTQEDSDILFGHGYQFNKRNDLSQLGEYACIETVKIYTDINNIVFDHVRVLGPLRKYTQVEISKSDSEILKINPPIRDSGCLEGSASLWIEGPCGKIYKNECCIIANRHIHMNTSDNIGHTSSDIIEGKFNDKIIDNIHIKSSDNYVLELHIDKSDAEYFKLSNGDYIDIE